MPILEIINPNTNQTSVLTQSLAISRHFAKLTNLNCANVKPYENNGMKKV